MEHNITALILAGGKSSRMGQDKALLSWQGQTLIERIYDSVSFLPKVAVMTPWPDRYRSLLSPQTIFIPEQRTTSPLQALAHSWEHIETPWVLLLACDLPLMTAQVITQWTEQLNSVTENGCSSTDNLIALLPRSDRGWDSLSGFYHRRSHHSIRTYIHAHQDYSFQRWLNNESVMELELRDRQCLFNCNSSQDYQQLLHQLKN